MLTLTAAVQPLPRKSLCQSRIGMALFSLPWAHQPGAENLRLAIL